MPQVDRTTARTLVESGYMPLADYVEDFDAHLTLKEVPSPSTAPQDEWAKLERLLISTTFNLK